MIYPIVLFAASSLFAILAWRDLRLGLCLLAASLPTYLLRYDIGPIPMTLLETFALILVAVWIYRSIPLGLKPRGLFPQGWSLPIALLLAAATVGVFVAPDTLGALGIWKAYFIEPMLVLIVAVNVFGKFKEACLAGRQARDKNLDGLLMAIGAGGLFVALCAIVQALTGWGIPAPWDVEGRAVSIFPYPNAVGLYLAPVIVIAALQAKRLGGWKALRIGWIVTAIASLIAIVLSQSEAAIVAVVATLLIAGVAAKRSRKIAVTVTLLVAIMAIASPSLRAKLTFDDYSGQVRRSQWSETIVMLKDHAILGAGLNGYPAAMEPYHADLQYEIFQYPHTVVLNVWTELGLLGLLAFALLAFAVCRDIRPTLRSAGSPPMTIAFFALLAMTIHGLADVPFFKNDLAMMTALLLAVIAASSYASIHGKQI